jgi:hypothetical protein
MVFYLVSVTRLLGQTIWHSWSLLALQWVWAGLAWLRRSSFSWQWRAVLRRT